MRKFNFLIFFICFFSINVYAQDFSVGSTITAPTCTNSSNCSGGHYTGHENYEYGIQSVYSIGTRYTGRLSDIKFNLPLPSSWTDGSCFATGDISYTLTLNMATNDWRNHFSRPFISSSSSGTNWATSNVTFVSRKKIYFNFKIPNSDSCIDFLYVRLYSPNVSDTSFTGETNWNLSSIVLTTNFASGSGSGGSGSGGSGSGGSGTTATNQDIINNQNSNTSSIINNQNDNTNNIIENNNQNTQDIIDNQTNLNYICKKTTNKDNFKWQKGYYYENNGTLRPANAYYYVSDFIHISGTTLTFTGIGGTNYHLLYYDKDYNLIQSGLGLSATTYTLPENIYYIKFSLSAINYENFSMYTDDCVYIDKSLNISNSIDNLDETIKDDSIDDKTGFFTNFTNNMHGLSSIITLPLTTIQSLANTSCLSLSIPIPFTNSSVSLPCMTTIYETYIPSVFNIWQIVSFGIISYFICLDIFKIVKGFKDPNEDKIEVLDL